jgi:hypothetical protein
MQLDVDRGSRPWLMRASSNDRSVRTILKGAVPCRGSICDRPGGVTDDLSWESVSVVAIVLLFIIEVWGTGSS